MISCKLQISFCLNNTYQYNLVVIALFEYFELLVDEQVDVVL